MDDSPAYAAAVILNPSQHWQYFEQKWISVRARAWLREAKVSVKRFYDNNWKDKHEGDQADEHITAPANLQPPQPLRDPTPFEQFLAPPAYYNREPEALIDEYKEYNRTKPAPAPNALHWWRDHAQKWPNMAQMAFDLLSIPAISAECERVFSQTKLLITGQRNRLGDRVIEAVECFKHWYKASAFE